MELTADELVEAIPDPADPQPPVEHRAERPPSRTEQAVTHPPDRACGAGARRRRRREVIVNGKPERLTALQMLRTNYLESATRLPARLEGATPKDADTVLGHAASAAALARELRDHLPAKQ